MMHGKGTGCFGSERPVPARVPADLLIFGVLDVGTTPERWRDQSASSCPRGACDGKTFTRVTVLIHVCNQHFPAVALTLARDVQEERRALRMLPRLRSCARPCSGSVSGLESAVPGRLLPQCVGASALSFPLLRMLRAWSLSLLQGIPLGLPEPSGGASRQRPPEPRGSQPACISQRTDRPAACLLPGAVAEIR